jgi:starch synthase
MPEDFRASESFDSAFPMARRRILFVTPELADFIKAGGLGDVSAALPRALRRYADVRVLIPAYRPIARLREAISIIGRLPGSAGVPACDLGRLTTRDGLVVYVLLAPELYDREGGPYGDANGIDWQDNDVRFARLCLGAADMAAGLGDPGWRPDLLHLNDWPAALTPGYLAWRRQPTPTLLTIHNLAYQGLFPQDRLPRLSIPDDAFQVDGVEFHGRMSFLKCGIYYASHITTVSATYAEEITSPELGCGLDGLLRDRAGRGQLSGILNGIEAGPPLEGELEADNWKAKRGNAEEVRRAFGLATSAGPLFAIVSRLVHQKGVDLVIDAADTIVRQGGQLVVIGRGEPRFEGGLRTLAAQYRDHVGVNIGYEDTEARRLYCGSDFLLMPSRFEPCGLTQMYAQRAGSLPIAHKTGGLADTIDDGRTGFLFSEFSLAAMLGAVHRAFETFGSGNRLTFMRRMAMSRTFDWSGSAARYARLYRLQSVTPGAGVH